LKYDVNVLERGHEKVGARLKSQRTPLMFWSKTLKWWVSDPSVEGQQVPTLNMGKSFRVHSPFIYLEVPWCGACVCL